MYIAPEFKYLCYNMGNIIKLILANIILAIVLYVLADLNIIQIVGILSTPIILFILHRRKNTGTKLDGKNKDQKNTDNHILH